MDKQLRSSKTLMILFMLIVSACDKGVLDPLSQSENSVQQDSAISRTEATLSPHSPQVTRDLSTSPTLTLVPTLTVPLGNTDPSLGISLADTQSSPTSTGTDDSVSVAESEWKIDTEFDSVGPDGVSPEAILLEDGRIRLYVTSRGIEVWESADGLSFERVPANTPMGADPTLVRTSDGWRMYFTQMPPGGPDTGGGNIRTAISKDGLDWGVESYTGISQENDHRAWGVPDSFVLSDGRVRVMWTDMMPPQRREVIRSATSSDGVTFRTDEGVRLSGGFVDSYVLPGAPSFMLVSTSPPGGPASESQRLFLATSDDGLEWVSGDTPLLDRSPRNALDPTAILIEEGKWRVYYTLTDGPDAHNGFRIASAILTGPVPYEPSPTLPAPAQPEPQLTDVISETVGCEEARYSFADLGVVLTAQDAGNSNPMAPMANPSSLLLSDGRVRMFFTNAGAGIGSAISGDAIDFDYEGIRISGPEAMQQGVNLGPLRVYRLPDGRVRLFVGSSQTGVQSFVSSDEGETFEVESGERITQVDANMPAIQKLSVIPISDGRWRGYFGPAPQHSEPGGEPDPGGPPDHWIRSATSSDLLEWSVEPGVLVGSGAAHLTASAREVLPLLRDDGCVTLFYQLNKPQDAGIHDFSGVAVIGYSTSTDGIRFRKQFVLINERDPAGPDVLQLSDGTYLMYHDSTDYAGYGHGIRVGLLEFSNP